MQAAANLRTYAGHLLVVVEGLPEGIQGGMTVAGPSFNAIWHLPKATGPQTHHTVSPFLPPPHFTDLLNTHGYFFVNHRCRNLCYTEVSLAQNGSITLC